MSGMRDGHPLRGFAAVDYFKWALAQSVYFDQGLMMCWEKCKAFIFVVSATPISSPMYHNLVFPASASVVHDNSF